MIRFFLLLLCFASYYNTYSQIPGYQGKRFFVEVGTSFWFNSFNPRANNVGPNAFPSDDTRQFTLQEHYFLKPSYVLSRKILFSLEYEYSKTGLHIRNNPEVYDYNKDVGAITPSRLIYGLMDQHSLFYHLYAHKINFSFSHYFKPNANLAPLGWYAEWGVDAVFAQGVLLDQKVTYGHDANFNGNKPSKEYTNPTGINAEQVAFLLGVHGGIGYRTIIANRIVFSGALRMTLFPQMWSIDTVQINSAEREQRYADRNNINYRRRVYQRVQAHYYLNVVIGIGVLLF
ncbi:MULTISPECIES: hypothetical protein [unclassified Aureispira]|uniref:hypothetical protein n=1 Tax=unclassified Aureispira TaxID=2649989 RepID=UPI0006971206|nr:MULTISPECIES: hypothetical protein [unclassified Aureispira]WMX16616.1 hypothetical protein QP953_09580 [Aureispira sp. CCB-E]